MTKIIVKDEFDLNWRHITWNKQTAHVQFELFVSMIQGWCRLYKITREEAMNRWAEMVESDREYYDKSKR